MLQFQTEGMSCNHCVARVTTAVKSVDANAKVDVDLKTQLVNVDTAGDAAAIAHAMEEAGYPVSATQTIN
ncbi:MAG: heavy-metal-associated domain-containing protein [Spirochaetia bacterium]|nr:heavy-metal-associated domain-containing protein [Spirochaetia bacterium]